MGEHGRCHERRERAGGPGGHHFRNNAAIGAVPQGPEQFVAGDAGQHDDGRHDAQPDEASDKHALLAFAQAGRGHGALGDVLVGGPIEGLDEDHAGQQGGPRDWAFGAANQCEAFSRDAGKIPADGLQRQPDNGQRRSEHAHPGDRIVNGNGAQSAKDGIERARHAQHGRQRQQWQIGAGYRPKEQRAGVERDRQIDEQIAGQEQRRDESAQGRRVIAFLQQFGRSGAALAIIDRQEHQRENGEAGHGRKFPPRQQQHLLPVHANQLIGGQVGEGDGAGDERPGQPTAGEEIFAIVGGGRARALLAAHAPHLPDGGQRHGNGQRDENGGLRGVECGHYGQGCTNGPARLGAGNQWLHRRLGRLAQR